MTINDKLDVIHSYGPPIYWGDDGQPNAVMAIRGNNRDKNYSAYGSGYDYDDAVGSLYRDLIAKMLTYVGFVEDDQ
jgi:hypothetical protein